MDRLRKGPDAGERPGPGRGPGSIRGDPVSGRGSPGPAPYPGEPDPRPGPVRRLCLGASHRADAAGPASRHLAGLRPGLRGDRAGRRPRPARRADHRDCRSKPGVPANRNDSARSTTWMPPPCNSARRASSCSTTPVAMPERPLDRLRPGLQTNLSPRRSPWSGRWPDRPTTTTHASRWSSTAASAGSWPTCSAPSPSRPPRPVSRWSNALNFLGRHRGRAPARHEPAPLDHIPRSWRREVIGPDRRIDRRAYTVCVLERLQDSLRRRDVFVRPACAGVTRASSCCKDRPGNAARPRVCRILGREATAAAETRGPGAAASTRPTAAPPPTCRPTPPCAIETEADATSITLTGLDKLDEPASLIDPPRRSRGLAPPRRPARSPPGDPGPDRLRQRVPSHQRRGGPRRPISTSASAPCSWPRRATSAWSRWSAPTSPP